MSWCWKPASLGRLPVVNFAAGGIATPADAALMMQLGVDGVFVGSGIFKSGDPARRAAAIVKATTHYNDPTSWLRSAATWASRWSVGRSPAIPRRRADRRARLVDRLPPAGGRRLQQALANTASQRTMKIGVLALQGDFAEHMAVLRRLGAEALEGQRRSGNRRTSAEQRWRMSKTKLHRRRRTGLSGR